MKRHLALLIAAFAISFSLCAEPVTPSQARRIAEGFFGKQSKSIKSSITPKSQDGKNAPYYIFNTGGKGFVIVAGDDVLGNIIGYSNDGSFTLEDAPSNLKAWLNTYAHYAKNATKPAVKSIQQAGAPIVEPLLGNINWGQGSPYNAQCPTYTSQGSTVNYYVGCVATAMAQIMQYYKYPTTGTGSRTYTSNIGPLSADFGSTTYRWDDMLDSYTGTSTQAQRDAVATLCAHLGISVNMTYDPSGSGAYSQMVGGALKNYFGYDKGISYISRDYYSSSEWITLIKTELNAKRPVFYSASNDDGMGGHAFVCDGYDSNDFVHINWGWEGRSNGYFMVNYLNPDDLGIGSGSGGYNTGQEIIIGIQPAGRANAIEFTPAIYGYTRFSASSYGNACLAMTYLENQDTDDFSGTMAAVLSQGDKVVKVLNSQPVTVKGVDPARNNLIDFVQLTMRDISTTADVPDGNYQLRFAYKTSDTNDWVLLRHSKGLPSYSDVVASNGSLNISTHVIHPDVELTQPIAIADEVFAKGSAYAQFTVFNKSEDVFLEKIQLKLTSATNPEESYVVENKIFNSRVYDNAQKEIYFLFDMPEQITSGKYEVTAFESKYESDIFDDSTVGRTVIDVLPESTTPVIRAASAISWIASPSNDQTIRQSESLLATFDARNYGASGDAAIRLCLKDQNNPDNEYVFLQSAAQNFGKGASANIRLYRRLDVNPGTYTFSAYYDTSNGAQPLSSSFDNGTITVEENTDLVATCTNFTLSKNLIKGQRTTGSFTIKALKDFSRTLYLRLRQFTNSGGEIVTMQTLRMTTGEEKNISFNYTPSVDYGQYTPILETKLTSSTFECVGGYDNYYSIINVGDGSGVSDVKSPQQLTVVSDGELTTVKCAEDNLNYIVVYDAMGRMVGKFYATDNQATFSLPLGLYLISAHTENGVLSVKHIVK